MVSHQQHITRLQQLLKHPVAGMTGSLFNTTLPMLFFAGIDDYPANNQWNTQALALSTAKRFRFVGIDLKLVVNMNGTQGRV
jgi:hypothetical protein